MFSKVGLMEAYDSGDWTNLFDAVTTMEFLDLYLQTAADQEAYVFL